MFLIAIVVVVVVIVSAAARGYTDCIGQSKTIPAGSGECTYTLNFDPRDVAGFAKDRADNARYSDGSFPCVLWVDVSGSPDFVAGESVTRWRDKSTNEFTATPTAEAPELAIVDGVEAVRFNGPPNTSLTIDTTPDAISVRNGSGLTVTMLVYVVDMDYRNGGLYAIGAAGGVDTAFEMHQSDVLRASSRSDEWWVSPGPSPQDHDRRRVGNWYPYD